jgi:hypothetical protein
VRLGRHAGFFGKELRCPGVVVRAHAEVPDAALLEAGRRVERLLGGCPSVARNLELHRAELHVIGRRQVPTDLPMYRHLRQVPLIEGQTLDQRGRGYGGLHACCDEDSLLGLPTRRHADGRDICSHELAHTVLDWGLDPETRGRVRDRWLVARARWVGAYAATNQHELFAELTMWYVGSRGDHGSLADPPADGPAGLRAFDPESYALLAEIYEGRAPVSPARLDELVPRPAERSSPGEPVDLLVDNRTEGEVELLWLDYLGSRVSYGVVPPGSIRVQRTYAGHPWLVVRGAVALGPYVPGPGRARITVHPT